MTRHLPSFLLMCCALSAQALTPVYHDGRRQVVGYPQDLMLPVADNIKKDWFQADLLCKFT